MQQNLTNAFLHPTNVTFAMTSVRPLLYSTPPLPGSVVMKSPGKMQNKKIPNTLQSNFMYSSFPETRMINIKSTTFIPISESTPEGLFGSRNRRSNRKRPVASRNRRGYRRRPFVSRKRQWNPKCSVGSQNQQSVDNRHLIGTLKRKRIQQDQPQNQDQEPQQQPGEHQQQEIHTSLPFAEWYPLIPLTLIVLILNGMVCYLYKQHKKIYKKSNNVLLFNEACIDLFSAIVYVPAYIISFYYPEADFLRSTVFMYSIFLSILGLLLLAVERMWSILKPLRHFSLVSRSFLLRGIILAWVFPVPVSLINLVWAIQESSNTAYTIYLWVFWALLVSVLLITGIVYIITIVRTRSIIHKRYRKQKTNDSNRPTSSRGAKDLHQIRFKQELKVTWLGILLFFFHIIGYYPTVVVNLLLYLEKYRLIKKEIVIFTSYSYVLNGIFNPLVCFIMKKDYRTALLEAITYSRPRTKSTITFLRAIKTSNN